MVNLQKTMQDVLRPDAAGQHSAALQRLGLRAWAGASPAPGRGDEEGTKELALASNCALRIFCTLDVAFGLLARKLGLALPTEREVQRAASSCLSGGQHGWYAWMYDPRNKSTTRET